MKKILLLHGPNLNRLGRRDPAWYGTLTLKDIEQLVIAAARPLGYEVFCYQSNHEGQLIDTLQEQTPHAVGILINPGALSHYSYALHDALLDTRLPAIEVHLSTIETREAWRQRSVTAPACLQLISGKKELGYLEALNQLVGHLHHD